ncbi:hypothetical protein D3C85_1189140 [compost metagenome]
MALVRFLISLLTFVGALASASALMLAVISTISDHVYRCLLAILYRPKAILKIRVTGTEQTG